MPELTYTDLLPADFDTTTLRDDVRRGLAAAPRWLPPRWFYDKVGSELFEEITRLPEYYPTRTERRLLARHAVEILAAARPDTLVELGSGSSEKTTLLLDALTGLTGLTGAPDDGAGARYVAVDVSEDALHGAALRLRERYPRLGIDLVRADFAAQLDRLPRGGRRTVAFLGSTVGNLEPAPRASFLSGLRAVLDPGEHLLLGADLVKPAEILLPAYDDAAGVTAAFNLNVLQVLNSRLGADFDLGDFEHRALWDERNAWIEMRLRACRPVTVTVPDVGLVVPLAAGEEIRTEISAKFRPEPLARELHEAGFRPAGWWTDERGWFALSLWRAA